MTPSSERIQQALELLSSVFSLQPVTAAELEFYLSGNDDVNYDAFWRYVFARCAEQHIGVVKAEREKGEGQWEIAFGMRNHPQYTADDINFTMDILSRAAARFDMRADFSAKPFPNQPGSGIHIHLHMENMNGERLYFKEEDVMSDELKWSLGGLLATMRAFMPVFAPTEESRARFQAGMDNAAPTTLSWGVNNRSCALRLPDNGSSLKHIEHRVAGSDADAESVIAAILEGIVHGLTHRIEPGEPIYGDANLPSYNLKKLIA